MCSTKTASGVQGSATGSHLPFLPGSDLPLGVWRGNDQTIGVEDILNDPSQSELMGEPHPTVEYELGLL